MFPIFPIVIFAAREICTNYARFLTESVTKRNPQVESHRSLIRLWCFSVRVFFPGVETEPDAESGADWRKPCQDHPPPNCFLGIIHSHLALSPLLLFSPRKKEIKKIRKCTKL